MKRRVPIRYSSILFSAIFLLIGPIITAAQEKIAFTSFRDGNHDIYIMNPDGSDQTRLTIDAGNDAGPSFSYNDNKIVYSSGAGIYVMSANGTGKTQLTNDGRTPSFSHDGNRIVFVSGLDGGIYVMNADGSNPTRVPNVNPIGGIFGPVFSPDGTKIAFTDIGNVTFGNATDEIFIVNIDGSNLIRLTDTPGPGGNFEPKFHPDGSKIVFPSSRDGNEEIYVINVDGSNQTRLTTTPQEDPYPENRRPTYSPDGSKIAFSRYIRFGTQSYIYVMNSDGSNAVNLTPNSDFNYEPSWGDANARPTITPASGVTRVRNAGPSNSSIATVSDQEDAEHTLNVKVNGGTTATVNGITVSGISVDANGNVTANIAAVTDPCGSTLAGFTLRVTDNGLRFSQAILVVTTTPASPPGALPGNAFSGVTPGLDGRLYGVTYNCGTYNKGTLYVYNPASQAVTELHDFNGITDGAEPYDDLVFDVVNGKFYGTTSSGGPSGAGTIFTFDPATQLVDTIRSDFGGYTEPIGAPIRSNGYLYGVVGRTGGIYRMAPDGSDFTIIHPFTEFSTQAQPLTLGLDGMLYGVTLRGGILCAAGPQYGCGTIFRLKPVLPGDLAEQFQTLYQFQGPGFRNVNPFRSLIFDTDANGHNYLYGSTLYSVFRFDLNTSTLEFIFTAGGSNGGNGFPITEGADGLLYLTDYFGGPAFAGSVFSMNKDGTGLTNLRNFNLASGPVGPYGRLYRNSSGTIFGTTEYDAVGETGGVFTISTGANTPPVANNQPVTTPEDTAVPITLTASDANGDPLTFSVVTQPANGILTGLAPNLTYTPNANYFGADSFTFRASDGTAISSTATVSITVNGSNDAPIALADVYNGAQEDTTILLSLVASDPDGDPLTYSIVTTPANGLLSPTADPRFVNYTPNANYFGQDSFTFRVNDGNTDSNTATKVINIVSVNDRPVAVDDFAAAETRVPVTIAVLANDTDPENDPISVVSAGAGGRSPNGTIAINPNGTVTYTSDRRFVGTDLFPYQIRDSGGALSIVKTITVVVSAPNSPPKAVKDSATTAVNTPVLISVLANDTDANNDLLSVTAVTQGVNGIVTNNGNGTVIYTPGPGFRGRDTFTYAVSDGRGGVAIGSVSVRVQ